MKIDTSRADFETWWAQQKGLNAHELTYTFLRTPDGTIYYIDEIREGWSVWQASRKQALEEMAEAPAEPAYVDSTPHLSVGNSAFKDWFFHYENGRNGDEALARAAYAAGMGDPLVMANPDMQVWTNTTVPMPREEPEAPAEVNRGDTVKWGSGPEDFEVVRQSGFERLWVLRRLGTEGGLFRARQEDLQVVRRARREGES